MSARRSVRPSISVAIGYKILGVSMTRLVWIVICCGFMACTPEVLLARDAGHIVDAGVVDPDGGSGDAGIEDFYDAGIDVQVDAGPLCAIEPFEVPFECEGDEDWCDPRDQTRAFNDLAAVWSRIEDNAWVIEVRTWGRMPFFDGERGFGELRVVWTEPGQPFQQFRVPPSGTLDDCEPGEPNYFGSGFDFVKVIRADFDDFNILCLSENQPRDSQDATAQWVDTGGCSRWSISDDFSTWRVRIPLSSTNTTRLSLFSVELLIVQNEQCIESTGFLTSQGGAGSATFQPLSSIEPACRAR